MQEKIKELEELKIKFCKVNNLPKDIEGIFIFKKNFERDFGNDFISKDKIKAKIEELNKDITNAEAGDYEFIGACRYKKIVLLELLEEKYD